MNALEHKTAYENKTKIAVELPLIDELKEYHTNGTFALVEDPKRTKKALILGMFVLRPAQEAWKAPVLLDGHPTLYGPKKWAFNVKGADGGWLIANGSVVDAYRLALQYGVSDAVMVGSTTVAKEGVPHGKNPGYLWQPYGPANWPHVKAADPQLYEKIMKQRQEWQRLGYLSNRRYPAQIVITQSGKESSPDILDARIFHSAHPDGSPIEAYILTSKTGAERIKSRAAKFGLEGRIDEMLIVLSPKDAPEKLELSRVPQTLYDAYGMMMVNHDGGQTILSEFSKAGVLPQINLTLARNQSVRDVLQEYDLRHAPVGMTEEQRDELLKTFEGRVQYFFTTSDGKIPRQLEPIQIITDGKDQVAVVAFDARNRKGL